MEKSRDLIHMHFIVVILGFTAILGKLINESAETIVFWRLLFASAGLATFIKIRKKNFALGTPNIVRFLSIGIVVAIHWICFFGAIKLSSVSVTLIVLSSTTLFTSILEPLFFSRKFEWIQLALAFLVIAGIALIFRFEFNYALGIWVGIISAILAALFTVLNKKYAKGFDPNVVSFYELFGGWITVMIYNLLFNRELPFSHLPSSPDLLWLAILGLLCTSYAYTASVKVMRSLSAYMVSLSVNMEPIYGILLGVLIFGESEQMTGGFYLGAILILASVFLYPFVKRWERN